jgi:thymidylate synthase (FAD)
MQGEKLEGTKVHDHGVVNLIDVMGTDEDVEQAARISYGDGTRSVSKTRSLLRYLMRHKHTSPFEMCEVKFYLKLPIFVMRQIVRHRTANLNEYSGRYSVMSDDMYMPDDSYINKQSTKNNQGRGEEHESKGLVKFEFNRLYDNALQSYQNLLDLDIARELARSILPVGNYTEVIWKIDLNNFFHFCKLRLDSHAQIEVRDYAKAMYELVKPKFPCCCEAFEDYILNAKTFSAKEMEIIKDNLQGSWVMSKYGLSNREADEFLKKLN